MKRRILSMLLALAMLLSLVPTAVFANTGDGSQEQKKPLVYVSIGDSMTNGYGLEGYEGQSGLMNYGVNTYANKFAAWLAGYPIDEIKNDQLIFTGEKGTVDHRQLAFSGMRAEDLHWLLDLDYKNTDLMLRVGSAWEDRSYVFGSAFDWEEDNWPADRKDVRDYWYMPIGEHELALGQTAGDQRTWYEVLDIDDGRLGDGVARMIYSYYYNPNAKGYFTSDYATQEFIDACVAGVLEDLANPTQPYYYPEGGEKSAFIRKNWLQVAGEFYQESVADADIVSLALGNTNFGTWMFDWMQDIFGSDKNMTFEQLRNKFSFYNDYQLEYVNKISTLDKVMQDEIEKMLNEYEPMIEEYLGGGFSDAQVQYLKHLFKYCTLSFIINYMGALERIVALNPDVKLIQMALINAYDTGKEAEGEDMSMAALIDMLYSPLNGFIAALPTYMQAQGKWQDATFYYVDAGHVETLSEVFGNDFYVNAEGERLPYPGLDPEKLEEVAAADFESSVVRDRFRFWIAGDTDGRDYVASKTYFPGTGDPSYGEMWKHVLDELFVDANKVETYWDPNNTSKTGPNGKTTYQKATNIGTPDFFGKYDLMFNTDEDLIEFAKLSPDEIRAKLNGEDKIERDWAFSLMMYLMFENAIIEAGKTSIDVASFDQYAFNHTSFDDAFSTFAQKLYGDESLDYKAIRANAIPEGMDIFEVFQLMSDTLVADSNARTMMALGSRMEIGTGIGGHTSEGGHDTLFKAIVEKYEAGYTSNDETEKNILAYLKDQYPNLYEQMFGGESLLEKDDLALIFELLKMSDSEALAGRDLVALEAEIRATLKAYENAHSAEEEAKAQAAADTLYLQLVALATAVTGSKYEVTDKSFYVSLGDSNVNGYGLDGYKENLQNGLGQVIDGAAPVELAKKLYGDDWRNHFGQLAQGALRSEDMLSILTGKVVNDDDYWKNEIAGNLLVKNDIAATSEKYVEAIKDADLISVAIGGGNITTFVGYQVDQIVDADANTKPVEMDWERIEYTDETMVELNKFLDEMVPLMDAMGMMDKYLPEDVTLENCGAAEFGRVLLESLLYGYASYNYYYPQVLETLRALNPDAQLLILGMFNPVDDWTMEMDGEIVNIGGITANLMEMANLQNLAFALQTPNTSFVDLSDNITFLDAAYAGKDAPTFDVYYESVLKGNGKEVHANEDGHKYMTAQMLAALSGIGYDAELDALLIEVYDALSDEYLTTAEKLELLANAYATVKELGALAAYPEIAVIEELCVALAEESDLTDDETLAIILHVLEILTADDELTKAQKADQIYTILLNDEDMTTEDKLAVLAAAYTVLDKYGYVDGAIGFAFLAAYNAAKENGYIDAAIKALDIAKAAVKLAKVEVEKFDLAEAEEVLADAKALVVEELKNIVDTMDKIQGVLATEELTPALYQELLSFEQELEKHCVTAVALARELNEALSPYVFELVDDVVGEALAAVDFIHQIAEDAYEFVTGIPGAYAEWVEEVGAKVDAISPELGALVREYLKANGDDAMAILYAYGDVAIQVLISDAVAACGDITDASINFLRVIVDNAPVMHEAIQNNAEVQALLAQLTENLKKAKDIAEDVIDSPFVTAYKLQGIDKETALNAVYAELVRIHNMAYPAVMSALHAIDPLAAEDFCAAYEALCKILCTTYNAADGYLGWVAEHAEAMACELLCALLDNTWEFVVAASPVVDQVMYDWLYTHPYEVIEFCSENAAEIEALIEKYGPAVVGVIAYIGATYGPEVLDFIINNPCEALDMFMDWYNKYGYRIWPMIDVYLEALGVYDAIDEQLEIVKAMLSELDAHILAQIAALKAALLDASEELRAQIEAEIEALYEQLMAFLKANISAYYVVGPNSYYVALGDAGAYGPAADKLAAELGMTDKYANLTFADASAGEVLAALNAAEIAKADLITLGFGANTFTAAVAADVMNAVFGEIVEKDWAALVGEEGAAAIEAALAELTAYVAEEVEDEAIAALLTAAVESFAYTYINHLVDYVVVSEAIHEINADALLVLVGMHNPMDGVVIALDEETELDLGEYLNYLVMLTNIYSFGYALIAEDTIYVDAPDVETNYDGDVMDIMTFVTDLLGFEEAVVKYQPTDAGYEYIQEQIYNALNPTLAEEEEACQHGAPANLKFQWAGDYSTCVAVYTCSICGEAFTKECLVEILETKNPTVEEEGYVKYQASVEIAGVTYTDTQIVKLAKLDAPDTGDTTMIGLYVTVMLVAAAGAVVVLKKKKHA